MEHLTLADTIASLVVGTFGALAALAAFGKYLAVPRIMALVRTEIAAALAERDKNVQPLHDAEERAIAELLARTAEVEKRMANIETAHVRTEGALERAEVEGRRQTQMLEVITEAQERMAAAITELAVSVGRLDERTKKPSRSR